MVDYLLVSITLYSNDFFIKRFGFHRDDDDEDAVADDIKGTAKIMAFFGKNDVDVKPHQFFQERCLEPVSFF